MRLTPVRGDDDGVGAEPGFSFPWLTDGRVALPAVKGRILSFAKPAPPMKVASSGSQMPSPSACVTYLRRYIRYTYWPK
ncbi:hypothetical protein VTH06DRAFT_7009 [Thermothelomyces fergusii]